MRARGSLLAVLVAAGLRGLDAAEVAAPKPERGGAAAAPSTPAARPAEEPGLEASLAEVFTRADANADGRITEEEWRKGRPAILFNQMDTNGDRALDGAEVRAATQKLLASMKQRIQQLFVQLDTNKDGALSPDEFSAYAMRQELPGWARIQSRIERAQGPESPIAPPQPIGGNSAREFLKKLDKDGDGKISRDEFPGPEEAFRRMDKNGDAAIDEEELKAVREGATGANRGR